MPFHQRQYDTTNNRFAYKINGLPLEQVESYKDLGVLFDPFLLFDQHISNIVSKAYSMLGLMQRNFRELSLMKSHSYEERLRVLQLPTSRYRQLKGDMIQLY